MQCLTPSMKQCLIDSFFFEWSFTTTNATISWFLCYETGSPTPTSNPVRQSTCNGKDWYCCSTSGISELKLGEKIIQSVSKWMSADFNMNFCMVLFVLTSCLVTHLKAGFFETVFFLFSPEKMKTAAIKFVLLLKAKLQNKHLSQGTVVLRVSRQLLIWRVRDRIPSPTFFCRVNDLDARSKNELETKNEKWKMKNRRARERPLTREHACSNETDSILSS